MLFVSNKADVYKDNIKAFSKVLFLGLCLMFFVDTWNIFLNTYGGNSELTQTMKLFIGDGSLASNFYYLELGLGIILPIILILIGGFNSAFFSALAGLFMIIGMFFARFDAIVGGQLLSRPSEKMDFTLHHYQVSSSELSIFIGGLGVAAFVYFLGERLLNLKEESHS